MKSKITIEYCAQCGFLLRANWLAAELLTTFSMEVDSLSLVPSGGGVFKLSVNDELIFDRKTEGRYLEPKEYKQRVRDFIAPDKDLGHSDSKGKK